MNRKSVVLIGATGLIGGHLLKQLQSDPQVSSIKVLARRPLILEHPKITTSVLDFADHKAFQSAIAGHDVVFCAVGTTNQQVKGNKKAYEKVDYDIPVNAAKFSAKAGCSQFVLVSSSGANKQSNNFYLKLKGRVEETISSIDLPTTLIFRPSLLLGKRNENRPGERIGKMVMTPLSFLLPSHMKPISALEVATAMLAATKKELKGVVIFHYEEMKRLSHEYSNE